MANLIDRYPRREFLSASPEPFVALLKSIVGQQLSVAAAHKIWLRFQNLFPAMDPRSVKDGDESLYRDQGLSRRKVEYVKNIAKFFIEKETEKDYWQNRSDETLRNDLLGIKGVGQWTVDMFMIFHLNRPDVLPLGDLGVVKAIRQLYFQGEERPKEAMLELGEQWKPYRTVASWYLWRHLDNEPVQY